MDVPVDVDRLQVIERYVRRHVVMTHKTFWMIKRLQPRTPQHHLMMLKELLTQSAERWKNLYDAVGTMIEVQDVEAYEEMVQQLIRLRTFWSTLNLYRSEASIKSYMRRFEFGVRQLWEWTFDVLETDVQGNE